MAGVNYEVDPDLAGASCAEADMKAIVIHGYGSPEVLKYEDYPDPVPSAGEVLVRVAASSVNPFDFKVRSGSLKDFIPLTFPAILGLDVSGTVESVGPGVTTVARGDNAESLICWAASTKNRSYSGFYCAPDLEQKTGIRNAVQTEEEPRFHLRHGGHETAALKS